MRLAMMNPTRVELLILALAVVPVLLMLWKSNRPSETTAVPARHSRLCSFGFLCALGALALAVASHVVAGMIAHSDLLGYRKEYLRDEILLAEVLRYGALLPALSALAFAMAGIGAVRESGGALRGRALGRSAVFLALVVGAACLGRV